jgi:hypothetical protein
MEEKRIRLKKEEKWFFLVIFHFFSKCLKKVNVGVWGRSTNRGWARLEKHNIQMGMVVFEKKIIFENVFFNIFFFFRLPLDSGIRNICD